MNMSLACMSQLALLLVDTDNVRAWQARPQHVFIHVWVLGPDICWRWRRHWSLCLFLPPCCKPDCKVFWRDPAVKQLGWAGKLVLSSLHGWPMETYSALMGSFLIQTHHLDGCRCMDMDGLLAGKYWHPNPRNIEKLWAPELKLTPLLLWAFQIKPTHVPMQPYAALIRMKWPYMLRWNGGEDPLFLTRKEIG